MPPFKAGGANAAIQSADNLAWKLAAVVHGQAGHGLLDTFHVERYPVGRFSAHQSLTGPTTSFLRREEDAPALPAGEEAPMFALLVGYQYHSAAVINEEAGPDDGVALVDELRGQPGTRVPHLWIERDGSRVSTLDLLGTGFTLFTGDGGGAWPAAAASAAKELGVPITVHRIGAYTETLGLGADGALVVRPDAFVGWRTTTAPEGRDQELVRNLSTILDRA
jgi:hypothetical protein